MTLLKQKIILSYIIFSIILIEGMFSCLSASGRVLDVDLMENSSHVLLSVTMEERPDFALRPLSSNRILLTLFNVAGTIKFERKTPGITDVELQEDPQNNQIRIRLSPDKTCEKIEWAWIENDGIFRVLLTLTENDKYSFGSENIPVLSNILFGFKENAARMVMALDHNPSWEIRYSDPSDITLGLVSSAADIEDKIYESDKWIREVNVNRSSNLNTEIFLNLETELNHAGLFWMEMGNRLVMDLYNDPSGVIKETAMLLNREGAGEKKEKEPTGSLISSARKVRMKIHDNALTEPDFFAEDLPPVPEEFDGSLSVKPRLDNNLPEGGSVNVSLSNLDSGEAFMFGRIQQAREIHDYEMGVTLINRFLKEYPRSSLAEILNFWRGDFYYSLWQTGDEEAGKRVIPAYQFAINRFGRSERVPWAYIRMAQVGSLEGDSFQALGFLSLVFSRGRGAYTPLSHLTRGKIYLNAEQPDRAIPDFKILMDEYPESSYAAEAGFWMAAYYHEMGLYEEAEKNLAEITDKNSDIYLSYPEYLLLRAKNYLYLKDYDRARDYLFRAVNTGGQQESVDLLLSRIGDTYHNQENTREAEKYYRMVIDYYPETEGSSIAKIRLADYFSDITVLEDLSREKSNEPLGEIAILEKGYQLFERGQYAEIIKTLDELIRRPVQTETRREARRLYVSAIEREIEELHKGGLYRELVDLYRLKETLIRDTIHPRVLLLTAEAYAGMGLNRDAIAVYRQIMPHDLSREEKGAYYMGFATGYMANNDNREAAQILEKMADDSLESGDKKRLDLIRANIYKDLGKEQEAYHLYRAVTEGGADLPEAERSEAWLNMGTILKNRKEYNDARTAMNSSIALALDDREGAHILQSAYRELGEVFRLEGNANRAIKAYEKAFELGYDTDDSGYWDTRYRLALLYLDLDDIPRGEEILIEIFEEADDMLQRRAEIKLGSLRLERQLRILSIGKK